ncbi:MAG: hypothetical protein SOW25_03630 [Helicobacter sp.]|nr:hypothetical protein [Helicobacteraceae bacterium]MDY3113402.1 hypothetical protein [Helicobacter sp.]
MIILNHKIINPLNIVKISDKDSIDNSLPNDFLIINCDNFSKTLQLANFCAKEKLSYACKVDSIKEALMLVNLSVGFLLCEDLKFAKSLQKLAEKYLFDAKVLLTIKAESQIQKAAKYGIDGVIFANF